MDNSTITVLDQLENQLYELVEKMQQLQQSKVALETSLLEAQSKLKKKQEEAQEWKEKYEALKAVQGMKTDNTAAKKRTLHHIDALINEVDACIAQINIED
jgi:acetyl-CoA carboxylase alpha subunit